jgi:hypothetical protein
VAGVLVDPDDQVTKIAAIKRAAPAVFVNARTDTFWLGAGDLRQTLARLRRYVDAGADGATPAARASSPAGNLSPPSSATSIRERAGSPIAFAGTATSLSPSTPLP